MGKEVHAELLLDDGQMVTAQVPREWVRSRVEGFSAGTHLHIRPRNVHSFN
jgi:hypothetical protein